MEYRLGDIIRQRRRELHYTQESLAEAINVTTGYIGQLERGEAYPSYKTLAKLIALLDIDPRLILDPKFQNNPNVCDQETFMLLMEVDNPVRDFIFDTIRVAYRKQQAIRRNQKDRR